MTGARHLFAVGLALLVLMPSASRAQDAPSSRPRLRSAIRQRPIRIDGRLDDADWAQATVGEDFTERVPRPGAEPPVATEVRVLHDAGAIYVAVTSYLGEGETPRALELTRDSTRVWSDDAITLKFDVRRDRRSTLGFAVNPAGTQIDFLALDNGRVFRVEYDAVWEVASSIDDDRWTAEFRIPIAALGLSPAAGGRLLGFNVTRDHNAAQAIYDWSHLPPEFGAASAMHYGDLEGADDLGGGVPVVLNPYVLMQVPPGDNWPLPVEVRGGGEARVRVGDDTWVEMTVLTDFAEVDNDSQVVNLDRFALFFPERRPFFLNGLDVFAFGESGEAQLFFTRRIGLDQDAQSVPVFGGVKVYGREGPLRFGFLDVATAANASQPAANWGVARLRMNLGEASYLGALVASRVFLPDDVLAPGADYEPGAHTSIGIDGLVRALDARLELSGFGALTHTDATPDGDPSVQGLAGRAAVRWRGQEWMPTASILALQAGFDPVLGFLRRPAIVQGNARVPWVGRNIAPGLRTVRLGASGRVEVSEDFEELLRLNGGYEVFLESDGKYSLSAGADYVEDVVRDDFELIPGLTVRSGTYRGVAARLDLATPGDRNPELGVTLRVNNAFFGGTAYQVDGTFAAALGPHFRTEVSTAGAFLDLPNEELRTTLAVNGVLSVTPNPRLVVDLVGQLNTVANRFLGLARLRWRYRPGSDLFLVYRATVTYGAQASDEHAVTLKVAYRHDALL